MRILFLNPVGTIGGAERVLLNMLSSLRQSDPDLELGLIALDNGPLLEEAKRLGVIVQVVPLPQRLAQWGDSRLKDSGRIRKLTSFLSQAILSLLPLYGFIRRLRKVIRSAAPDLIHSNGIKTHLLARFAGPKQVPIVWHIHDFYGSRPAAAKMLHRASRGVAAAIAISVAVARDVGSVLPGIPVTVIRNTVDTVRFSPGAGDRSKLDRLAALPELPIDGVRIGLVAAYARWKGHELFLQAAAAVLRSQPAHPARFYIVGGPIYRTAAQYRREELEAMVSELGIADSVGFVPFQSEPTEVYRTLDVAVHASTQPEPFGLTIIEAMACGRAVIVSAAGGAIELFQNETEAIGVPPGNATALAEVMHRLIREPELRQRLGRAARLRVERDFHSTRLGPELLAVYRQVIGSM